MNEEIKPLNYSKIIPTGNTVWVMEYNAPMSIPCKNTICKYTDNGWEYYYELKIHGINSTRHSSKVFKTKEELIASL